LGRTAIFQDESKLLLHGMNLLMIRANTRVLPLFLHLLFQYLRAKGVFIALASRAVGQSSINQGKLKALEIAAPSIEEQCQIARVLTTVQRAIEQQQAIITTTHELKRSLMHMLFTEGLHGEAQKSTEIGLVPESWDVLRLGECCDVVSSAISYSDLEKAVDYVGDDAVDVMGVKVSDMNLPGNELVFSRANLERKMPPSILRKRLIAEGTIVFPKRGAAIATNKKRIATGWTVLDPNLIGVVAGNRLNSDFLFHQFQRVDLRKITAPGPTPQLNKKDLLPLWLAIPKDLNEQVEIATSIGALQAKIDSESAKLNLLTDLFKTLLHQLMTAQLRVNDLDLDALGVPTLD
jgi:type I restriction enzyme S subunit